MERYLVDECLGYLIVSRLRETGRDVVWVREGWSGTPDEEVLAWSARDQRVLLSEDYDYGDLIFSRGHSAYGVVVLQLSSFEGSWNEVAQGVVDRLLVAEDKLRGSFTTVQNRRTKARALPAAP